MLVGAVVRRSAALFVMSFTVSVLAVAVMPSEASAGFSCSSGGPIYEVRSGDSWYGIAGRATVSPAALVDANDASVRDLLVVGDRLCLPAGADVSGVCTSYTVRSGDSWGSISVRVGSSPGAVAAANGVGSGHTIHPGDVVCLPSDASAPTGSSGRSAASGGSGGSYTVVRGDSWSAIAARAEVSMRSLLNANGAAAHDVLLSGAVLRLPAGAKQPTPSRSASVALAAAPTQGPCGYGDTWGHARHGGRRHVGVDIFSGNGNYVYAVVDGKLTGRSWNGAAGRSGNAWTLTGDDGTKFFYAHLSDFAPQLRVGSRVRAGQIIGWIGSTGNSSAPHLHFEIRPGGGSPINPYPIVRARGACNNATPYPQPGGWVPERKR